MLPAGKTEKGMRNAKDLKTILWFLILVVVMGMGIALVTVVIANLFS